MNKLAKMAVLATLTTFSLSGMANNFNSTITTINTINTINMINSMNSTRSYSSPGYEYYVAEIKITKFNYTQQCVDQWSTLNINKSIGFNNFGESELSLRTDIQFTDQYSLDDDDELYKGKVVKLTKSDNGEMDLTIEVGFKHHIDMQDLRVKMIEVDHLDNDELESDIYMHQIDEVNEFNTTCFSGTAKYRKAELQESFDIIDNGDKRVKIQKK